MHGISTFKIVKQAPLVYKERVQQKNIKYIPVNIGRFLKNDMLGWIKKV